MEFIYSIVYYITFGYIALKVALFVWSFFRSYVLTLFGFVKDLNKYGEWVVVTGATDGIGKEYARQLAKRGFKIVLISRTLEKLEQLKTEIEDEFNVETKFLQFDFTATAGYDVIEETLKDLDIGILVNNVGMLNFYFDGFATSTIDDALNILNCNVVSDLQMTLMITKRMAERQRGLVIHISSIAQYFIFPNSLYSSTKLFMGRFVKSLQLECSCIEHQLVTPGYVATNMSKQAPIKFRVPTAEEYVTSAIRTIGISEVTCGYYYHELQKVLFSLQFAGLRLLPTFFEAAMHRYQFKRSRERRANEEAAAKHKNK